MSDWQQQRRDEYQAKGLGERSGFGAAPALLVVDFSNGFTDPSSPLGGDFGAELAVAARLLSGFRSARRPVIYTTVAYNDDLSDGGYFVQKVPALAVLRRGSPLTEIDARIAPLPGERVVEKQFASAFFGTRLDETLKAIGVDTTVITGATTSGCIRASVVDSLQYGFRTVVVRDAVGDRAPEPHAANLFDMDAKYADVLNADEVLEKLGQGASPGPAESAAAARANEDFAGWWRTA